MHFITLIGQLAIIAGFYVVGEWLSNQYQLLLPGSIIGLLLLLCCLQLGWIKLQWVERGAAVLLAELLLFFVPSTVGVVDYPELFGWVGVKTELVVLVSTVFVMVITGMLADYLYVRKKRSYERGL
ncbi:CidA/LrgA family holin-like protein [Bacillaceae bacterium SIJ1]|uniref:CidA/LrgA family holin-like protein n=1 Tax=Litoribacterium kuwaitense TaxID=1398745 RepID=UPI0013ECD1EC|nr:CidA/LrgA family holin-like protein [Litoribacterium kuwaitense]NGP46601.1 CidA/LrgA family holin-like protein [Litoribacterium kuwaitense]